MAQRVRDGLTGSSPLFEVVDRAGAVPLITLAVSREAVLVKGTDGVPLQGLNYSLDPAGVEKVTAACIHLANWQRLHDLKPKDSRLNDSVRIELIPVAAGEIAPADDAQPHPASEGTVSLSYADDIPPRIQIRLRNDSNERQYVALLDLTDSFKSWKLFADWIPAGGPTYWGGGRVAPVEIPTWRDATVRSTTDTFKVVAAIEDFDPERWTRPTLLGPSKTAGTRNFGGEEEIVVRTAEGVNAFWGATAVTVKTIR